MCNAWCIEFWRSRLSGAEVRGRRVIEVGSLDVNGSLRSVIEPLGPQAALAAGRANNEMSADAFGHVVGGCDDRGDSDGLLGCDARCNPLELGPGVRINALSEDLDDPATGQSDAESLIVTDAVFVVLRDAVVQNLKAHVEEGPLDAAEFEARARRG